MGLVGWRQRRCPSTSETVGCLAWQGEASRRADAVHASRGAARRDASPYPRNRRRTVSRQAGLALFQLPNHWRLSDSVGVPPSGGAAVASKRRLKPGHQPGLPSRPWPAFSGCLLPRRKLRVRVPAPFQRRAQSIEIISFLSREIYAFFRGPRASTNAFSTCQRKDYRTDPLNNAETLGRTHRFSPFMTSRLYSDYQQTRWPLTVADPKTR